MAQTQCFVLCSTVLIILTTWLGVSAESDSFADNLRDGAASSTSDSENDMTNSQQEESFENYLHFLEMQNSIDELDKISDDDSYSGQEPENLDLTKKASSFVRIGKWYPMNRFIRIGRKFDDPNLGYDHEDEKRASKFVRIGKSPSSFVRIGKSPSSFVRIGKSPSSFVRIGKSPSSFVRIGKSPSNFVRIGKSPSSFVRIGKSPSNFVRIGKSDELSNEIHKRMSSFVRIGKALQPDYDQIDSSSSRFKRSTPLASVARDHSSFVRAERSPSSFVRIGKSPSHFVRIGKSPSSFVRIGKSPSNFVRIGKSPSNFVRIGKSPSSFVRIGKSPSSFVRIGKSPSSFVRIGKSPSSFVRIGKSPSNFVRIGKSYMNLADNSDIDYAETADSYEHSASEYNQLRQDDIDELGLKQSESNLDEIETLPEADSQKPNLIKIENSEPNNEDITKRASTFMRIGKLEPNSNHISDSELAATHHTLDEKLGQLGGAPSLPPSPVDPQNTSSESFADGNLVDSKEKINIATRGSAFVRIGKIPSSAFVRIGKNPDLSQDHEDYNRRSRVNLSSFVRIGK